MTASGAVSLRCAATQLDGATRPSSCLIEGDRVVGVSYALCRVPICSQFRWCPWYEIRTASVATQEHQLSPAANVDESYANGFYVPKDAMNTITCAHDNQ